MQAAKSVAARLLVDFDLAPGAMRVEEDEQVGRSIALIFAIVALKLARLGYNRLPHFTDELDRRLVETDDRALGIGRLLIQVEHILHAGDEFTVHPRNAPHLPAPRLEIVLGQPPAHRLPGDAVVLGESDQCIRQQLKRPAGATRGRARAGRGDQQGFLFARELAGRAGALLCSLSAASRLPSTKRRLFDPPTPTLAAIPSSLTPSVGRQ